MITNSVRGAITIENDTVEEIKNAAVELFKKIIERNNLRIENISHIIFSTTKDVTKAYPAKFIREELNITTVPMMCLQEMYVENSLQKCIRVLVVFNSDKNETINHIYLNNAQKLRLDLCN